MTQPTWAARLTRMVAGEVRRLREERGLSAQQLAQRCAELGVDMSRATIADLETGRRVAVSVAELMVLAAALDVAPVLLVAPLGRRPTVEVLPGRNLDAWDVALWLSGQASLTVGPGAAPETTWLDWHDDEAIVPLHHRHDQLVEDLSGDGLWSAAEAGDAATTLRLRRELKRDLDNDLRAVRGRMRDLGLTPPELPAELAYIDQERPRERRR